MLYLQEQLRISTYKTVWSIGHKIRQGMIVRDTLYDLHGIVEANEIFIGDKQTLAERRKSENNKTSFFMAVEEIEGVYESQIFTVDRKTH